MRMRLRSFLVPILTLAVMLMRVDAGAGAEQRVSIRTEDGVTLAASWYEPSSRSGPAVILVHMLHRSRKDWDAVAQRLASEGIGALAFDLRGHGESTAGPVPGAGQSEYGSMVLDVRAVRRYLAQRSDVQPSRVGVLGASIGANLAALAASADGTIASLALLSPSVEYRGLRMTEAVRKIKRPILFVAGDDDPYASRSARELQKEGSGVREILILNQAGHGTMMLSRDPSLIGALVDWFRKTLL
jgi:dienelactone hydrolase